MRFYFLFFWVGKECDLCSYPTEEKLCILMKTFPYLVLTGFGLLGGGQLPFYGHQTLHGSLLCFVNLVTLSLPQAIFFYPIYFFFTALYIAVFSLLSTPEPPLSCLHAVRTNKNISSIFLLFRINMWLCFESGNLVNQVRNKDIIKIA